MTLYGQMQSVLDAVAGALGDPPDRQYVANGQPAIDCEQLTVHLGRLSRGTALVERPDLPCAPTVVTAIIQQTWCIPVVGSRGQPPPTPEQVDSGAELVAGSIALWNAAITATAQVDCRPAMIGGEPIPPQGGYAGWQVTAQWLLG